MPTDRQPATQPAIAGAVPAVNVAESLPAASALSLLAEPAVPPPTAPAMPSRAAPAAPTPAEPARSPLAEPALPVSRLPPATPEAADEALMREAFAEAQLAIGLTEPNPRVGCVISRCGDDGAVRIIGRGHTQQAGGPHAEVMALRDAAARGEALRGASVHVTLEPCAHHGRTPPCCDALVAAGVARVVYAVEDPFPQVAGRGAARLREAGIAVCDRTETTPGSAASHRTTWADAARALNIGFFSRVLRGRPWVRLKAAVSLDGRSALDDGTSQWITGEAARTDGHAWRRRAGALLTGVGSVLDDDPRLDVRLVETARQPMRVIVDSRLQMPPGARILQPPGTVLIYTADPAGAAVATGDAGATAEAAEATEAGEARVTASTLRGAADAARRAALQDGGVEITSVGSRDGKVDLPAMLADLARRGVNELHVEAGARLSGSFVREGLVDEYLIYLAPKLLGLGRPLAAFGPLAGLAGLRDAPALRFDSVDRIGDDLRILARPIDGWQP